MKPVLACTALVAAALAAGCLQTVPVAVHAIQAVSTGLAIKKSVDLNSDQAVFAERQKISQRFNNNPDTDAWHEQRQKVAAALGERVLEHEFNRVFDSLTQAMAELELKVANMERQSGYLTASGITLPPSDARMMRREAVNEWCKLNHFDAAVLDRPLRTTEMQRMNDLVDLGGMMARYEKSAKTLTFQLSKMGDRTRVKLRFSEVFYPGEVEIYYKLVWQAVDKQLFIDRTIGGAVERRG